MRRLLAFWGISFCLLASAWGGWPNSGRKYPVGGVESPVVIFLTTTGTGTFVAPSDWNSANNKIEVIGGGSGGDTVGGAGAGGGYSAISNLSLVGGTSYTFRVGAGGGAGALGGDTFFNRTAGSANTCADTTSVCAKGGGAPTTTTGGTGGASGSGTGTTKTSGGNGGNTVTDGGGGGGEIGRASCRE